MLGDDNATTVRKNSWHAKGYVIRDDITIWSDLCSEPNIKSEKDNGVEKNYFY